MTGILQRLNTFIFTLTLLLAGLSVAVNPVVAETLMPEASPCSMLMHGVEHPLAGDASDPVTCQDSGMAACVLGVSHCSPLIVLPANARPGAVPVTLTVVFAAHRVDYANPIADVSTPPPNTRS